MPNTIIVYYAISHFLVKIIALKGKQMQSQSS